MKVCVMCTAVYYLLLNLVVILQYTNATKLRLSKIYRLVLFSGVKNIGMYDFPRNASSEHEVR
jgi:hypothetical protein